MCDVVRSSRTEYSAKHPGLPDDLILITFLNIVVGKT
jgi:hypothetical protein